MNLVRFRKLNNFTFLHFVGNQNGYWLVLKIGITYCSLLCFLSVYIDLE